MCGLAPRIPIRVLSGKLFLQRHVFLCRGKRHWVILDLKRDKYLTVDRGRFEALAPSLDGWSESSGAGRQGDVPAAMQAAELATDLLNQGILTQHDTLARNVLTQHPLPTTALDPDAPAGKLSLRHAVSFFASSTRASRELARQPISLTVASVRARRHRNASPESPEDSAHAVALTSIFNRLRWFYPRSYVCLFDSLALIHFLARFHVYPDWVFGVTTDPFEAHCWVQAGSLVLNDTVERIAGFTPIMCV